MKIFLYALFGSFLAAQQVCQKGNDNQCDKNSCCIPKAQNPILSEIDSFICGPCVNKCPDEIKNIGSLCVHGKIQTIACDLKAPKCDPGLCCKSSFGIKGFPDGLAGNGLCGPCNSPLPPKPPVSFVKINEFCNDKNLKCAKGLCCTKPNGLRIKGGHCTKCSK